MSLEFPLHREAVVVKTEDPSALGEEEDGSGGGAWQEGEFSGITLIVDGSVGADCWSSARGG